MESIDNIQNRKFHEVFEYITPTLTKSFQLGNELLDRIPFNQVEVLEQIEEAENNNQIEYEDYLDLLPKLNLNVGDTQTKFISNTLIKNKNYKELIELLKRTKPFDSMPMLNLYSYARSICGKPISNKEYQKINADQNLLKKNTEQYEVNKPHFKNQRSEIKF